MMKMMKLVANGVGGGGVEAGWEIPVDMESQSQSAGSGTFLHTQVNKSHGPERNIAHMTAHLMQSSGLVLNH